MTALRTAAQQALEALERYQVKRQDFGRFADEITALRAALKQEEEASAWLAERKEYWRKEKEKIQATNALRAALEQQDEPVQEPYTSERHFALREAYCIGAADAFWKARPGTKDDGRTIAFDAGFARGFDKGTCLAEQRLAALAQQAEPVEPVATLYGTLPIYDTAPHRKPLTEEAEPEGRCEDCGVSMTTQSDALRLADALMETHPYPLDIKQAAAELRRLHEENDLLASAADKLRITFRDERMELLRQRDQATAQRITFRDERMELLRQRDQATAQRDALLEALKLARSIIGHPDDAHSQMINAVIKAVEETK